MKRRCKLRLIPGTLLIGFIFGGCGKGTEGTMSGTQAVTTVQTEYEGRTTEIPSTEKPVREATVTEKPTTEKPTIEKPTTEKPTTEKPTTESTEKKAEPVDYLVLVNKENALPDNWTEIIQLKTTKDADGDKVKVESATYKAFQLLQKQLAGEGINIYIGSAYRSAEEQQELVDYYMQTKGADYVRDYVAMPGYSEHNTGLAIDLSVPGAPIEDEANFNATWARIHSIIADYGFILRYPQGKSRITGYNYEYWHIRYIGNIQYAKEIYEKGITLEEFLEQ